MIRKYLLLAMFASSLVAVAQTETSGRSLYHAEATKYNALDHTKLRVSLNFEKKELYGEEWLTASPYFYPTDSLVLDAQAMIIHSVNLSDKKGTKGLLLLISMLMISLLSILIRLTNVEKNILFTLSILLSQKK